MNTSVMIIDGYASIRGMLALVLALEDNYTVIAEAASGTEALELLPQTRPQLVILDLTLPELSGLEVLRYLRLHQPTRVLVFTASTDKELISEALREQPNGYANKWESLTHFREALRAIRRGARYYAPSVAEIQDQLNSGTPPVWTSLTGRERAVVQMVAEGKSSKQVAETLSLSPRTVDDYRSQVMRKLGLPDLTALTRYAVRRGLVPLE